MTDRKDGRKEGVWVVMSATPDPRYIVAVFNGWREGELEAHRWVQESGFFHEVRYIEYGEVTS